MNSRLEFDESEMCSEPVDFGDIFAGLRTESTPRNGKHSPATIETEAIRDTKSDAIRDPKTDPGEAAEVVTFDSPRNGKHRPTPVAPPHDDHCELEKLAVGSMLLATPEKIREAVLLPDDFRDPLWRAVCLAVNDVAETGQPIDMHVIWDELRSQKVRSQRPFHIDNARRAMEAAIAAAGTGFHLPRYVATIKAAAAARRLASSLADAMADVRNGRDSAEILASLDERFADIRRSNKPDDRFRLISSADLAENQFEVEYLIPDVLVKGQPGIIAATHKTLKTSSAIDLAVSLVTGGRFLGYFPPAVKSRVLIMSGESGMATLKETAVRICRAAGFDLASLGDRLQWSEDLPRLDSASDLSRLQTLLERNQIEVLIVDPAYLCMPGGDAGNLFAQGELLRPLAEACRRAGTTLLLIHHNKKQNREAVGQPAELSDIAWSGFAEFARQWLLLARREPYVPGTGSHKVWLTVGGSAGHSDLLAVDVQEGRISDSGGRKWVIQVSKPTEVIATKEAAKERKKLNAKAEQAADDERKLLLTFGKYPAGETERVLGLLPG